jgi:hypothetical protein
MWYSTEWPFGRQAARWREAANNTAEEAAWSVAGRWKAWASSAIRRPSWMPPNLGADRFPDRRDRRRSSASSAPPTLILTASKPWSTQPRDPIPHPAEEIDEPEAKLAGAKIVDRDLDAAPGGRCDAGLIAGLDRPSQPLGDGADPRRLAADHQRGEIVLDQGGEGPWRGAMEPAFADTPPSGLVLDEDQERALLVEPCPRIPDLAAHRALDQAGRHCPDARAHAWRRRRHSPISGQATRRSAIRRNRSGSGRV